MKLYELLTTAEIQSEYKVVYFDYDNYERVEVKKEHYWLFTIKYIYVEDEIIYIEVTND